MSKESDKSKQVHLKGVRLSFPSLIKKAVFSGKETKFEATFLIPKSNVELEKKIRAAMAEAIAEAKVKVPSDKFCFKDGDESEYDGYEDCWSLKASHSNRPKLINRQGNFLIIDKEFNITTQDKDRNVTNDGTDADEFYQGCYVYGIIDFWVQNNEFGKRLNANLLAVKFVKDGERLKGGGASAVDDFDDDFDMEEDDL